MAAACAQKFLGAFYTPPDVAQILVDWAVRHPDDEVLDPSCGEGVFLHAAALRIRSMDGPPTRIHGIEIDQSVYEQSLVPLLAQLSIPPDNITVADFFDVPASTTPLYDAVVGNPPFIRYQTFKGRSRGSALKIVHSLGVELSELASSWAPFILHATEFLATGGRLGMVVPAEIAHATYARPVVQYLARNFSRIYVAAFADRLFPELNEDALLLFGDGKGVSCKDFRFARFATLAQLETVLERGARFGRRVSARDLRVTDGRLRNHLLPAEVKSLYKFMAADLRVCRLGELADVGIGYVTGNNRFFHLTTGLVRRFGIPRKFVRASLLRSGIIRGLRFSRADWAQLRKEGERVYLLLLPRVPYEKLPSAVQVYLTEGMNQGVHKAYKCAVRDPWFSVPCSAPADCFMTYMSGEAPRIVWNAARILATNSTHEVRFKNPTAVQPWRIALAFCCSLSQLSSEIEGHPLGGGMLKLEPSEAERTLIARPELIRASQDDFEEMHALVGSNSLASAIDLADELVLRDTLGLTWDQIQVLRDGLTEIRETRRKKVAPA